MKFRNKVTNKILLRRRHPLHFEVDFGSGSGSGATNSIIKGFLQIFKGGNQMFQGKVGHIQINEFVIEGGPGEGQGFPIQGSVIGIVGGISV